MRRILSIVVAVCLFGGVYFAFSGGDDSVSFTGVAKGYGGNVETTLSFTDGQITGVAITHEAETQGIGTNAIEQMPELITSLGDVNVDVDVVAGATVTSEAIKEGAKLALEEYKANRTETAVANGYGGEVSVTISFVDGKIETVNVVGESETPNIGTLAIDALPEAIINAQSANVDVVAGATVTSNAILEAVGTLLND